MQCCDVERLIDAFWDGELDVATSARLQAHIDECHTCQTHYRPVCTLLSRSEPPAPPSGLRASVIAAVETNRLSSARPARPQAPRTALPRPWMGAIAASVAVAVTGLLVWQTGSPTLPSGAHSTPFPPPTFVPSPSVILPLAHALTLPAGISPLPVVAQAAAIEQLAREPRELMVEMPRRRLMRESAEPDDAAAMQDLSVILAGLSTIGA